jgi:hypothetical protein
LLGGEENFGFNEARTKAALPVVVEAAWGADGFPSRYSPFGREDGSAMAKVEKGPENGTEQPEWGLP